MPGFDINWGMAQPVNALGMGIQGFQQGLATGREMARENALSTYAANPDDPKAQAGLVRYEPRMAMQIREDTRKRERDAQLVDLRKRAAAGDAGALTELAGLDTDMWMKLDDRTKETVKKATSFMGQASLDVSRLPEVARAAAWGRYVQQAEASGMDIPTQYERYSPEALNAVVAEAGAMEKLIKQYDPDYRVVPQGGYIENVNPLSRTTPIQSGQGAPPATLPPDFDFGEGGAGSQGPRTFP